VIVLLFGGGGKIPRLMGDFAKGIKSFKAGLKDEKAEEEAARTGETPKQVGADAAKAPAEKNAANG
jgi:sec-independent protein translocase protein TatA